MASSSIGRMHMGKRGSTATAVKRLRKRYKQLMIESMGGECQICGYKKCSSVLTFHHLDPSTKELQFGVIVKRFVSWARIVRELRKCVLLCHNCHSEVHAGMASIPESAKSFDESYANVTRGNVVLVNDGVCPTCLKVFERSASQKKQKYCSRVCYNEAMGMTDLQKLVSLKRESHSNVKIAQILGVSEMTVRKHLKKLC